MAAKVVHSRKRVARKPSVTERLTRIFVLLLALGIGIALIYTVYLRLF